MMRRYGVLLVALFLFLLIFSAGAQEVVLQDDWGRTVQVTSPTWRIISLSPANTEIVFALGLDERLIGVTSYCNYPPEAQEKEKIGSVTEINLESVIRLEPDVVLAGSLTPREVVGKLEELGLKVFVLDAHTIEGVLEDLRKVAVLAGVEDRGEALVETLQEKLRQVKEKVAKLSEEEKPNLLHVIWHDPIWTAGKNTFIDEFITLAGGKNVVADLEGYVTLDLEEVLRRNPDIITVLGTHGGEKISYEFLLADERLQSVRAIQEKKVFLVDSDIVTRPGPRVIEALSLFAQILHPELFGAYEPPE
jgi:iron complex transport system substrate-binding protein